MANKLIKIKTINTDLVPAGASPLDRNPAAVYLASLSKGSRRTLLQALNTMAGILTGGVDDAESMNWSALRYQHTAALRARLLETYKPATINKFRAALRGVLKASWQLGLMTAEDYQRAADLKSVKDTTLPAGRELTQGEILALMSACENDLNPAGMRDAAIIGMMYSAGLRREEVISLSLANYDRKKCKLVITGKGAKERTAYLTNGAADALVDWLSVRGTAAGPLFVAINKGGDLDPAAKQLTPQAIYSMLARRALQAGVAKFSPHDLRRTFVSDLLEAGADIVTVAKMAGHASVNTTARYDRRPEQTKKKAAGLLHVPYHRKTWERKKDAR